MHGAPQLGLGSVLESADDVDVDVEADEEGDAELEDGGHHAEADPGVAAPVLLADLNILAGEFINFDNDTFVKWLLCLFLSVYCTIKSSRVYVNIYDNLLNCCFRSESIDVKFKELYLID